MVKKFFVEIECNDNDEVLYEESLKNGIEHFLSAYQNCDFSYSNVEVSDVTELFSND